MHNIALQRRLLHAEGRGHGHFAREREKIENELGGGKQAHLTVVALVARTHGSYIGDFVNRCLSGKSQKEAKQVLKDLSADYSAVLGRSVSVEELTKLANKHDRFNFADKAWETRRNGVTA
jgi:hypothetical protein